MKRLLITIPFLIFGYWNSHSTIKYTYEESVQQKEIVFEEGRRFDFGEIQGDTIITVPFKLKNVSDNTVQIEVVSTSCNCTEAELNRNILTKNEQGILTVSTDTSGKMGKVLVDVVLKANTKQKFYRVSLTGRVK